MRKIIICILLSFCFSAFLNAQEPARKIIDSTKKELTGANGNKRIDCLNLLAEAYYDLWNGDDDKQLDTACTYTEEAYSLAKNSGYKLGFGYALLCKAMCYGCRVDNNRNNNNTEANYSETYNYANRALQVGEEIKDYRLAGDTYDFLKWLERWKGDSIKFKYNVEKAIYYYEKPVTKKPTGHLNISQCEHCQGNEGQLAWLYQLLAGIAAEEKNVGATTDHINKTIHYYEMMGDNNSLGGVYSTIRQFYFRAYQYKLSEEAALKSISYYQKAKDVENEILQLNEMCKVYDITGEFEKGVYYGKRSIQLVEGLDHGNLSGRFSVGGFFWLCNLYKIAGDYETALDLIRRSRNYFPNSIDSVSQAFWSAQIGDVHRLMGNYDSALFYLKPFEKTVHNNNNFGKINLGFLYDDLKEYDKALQLIKPFTIFLTNQNRFLVPAAKSLMITAKALLGEKKYKDALQDAREAQIHLNKIDGRVMMIANYKLLSDIFSKLNIHDSAYYYLSLHTTLKDSLLNRQFFWRLSSFKKEAEEERKTSQINLLNKDNQLKEQKLKQESFVKKGLIIGIILLFLLGVFIFRNLSLKRKNEKLRLQKDLEMQQLESEKKQAELQQKAAELEMQALRAQMNPHFIFNCLSSINRFIFKNDNKLASDYLTRFSRLMRMVLMNSQKPLIPLEDELEMLRLYLDMERLRFKNAFDYSITI